MKTAIFNWLNHHILVTVPDPAEDNTVCVEIYRAPGTYDPEIYNAELADYWFSAESVDPNEWVLEGLKSAIVQLSGWGVRFHSPVPVAPNPPAAGTDEKTEIDEIPF